MRTRATHLAQYTEKVDLQVGCRSEVDIEIGTQVTTHILILSAVALILREILDEALIREQVHHGEIAETLTTAFELNGILIGYTMMTEGLIDPVGAGILIRIGAILIGSQFVGTITHTKTFVGPCLVHSVGIGKAIDELGTVGLIVNQMVVVDADAAAIILTALSGNLNSTIGTLVTI